MVATMTRALYKGAILAESEAWQVIDNVAYFPREAVVAEWLRRSETRTVCGWRGEAAHFDLVVDGEVVEDVAVSYERVRPAAEHIRGWVAFGRDVEIVV